VKYFFWNWGALQLSSFCVLLKNDNMELCQILLQGLGENTCSLQSALKNTTPGL